jgi:hypothetical protein
MIDVQPVILDGRGIRLEPLTDEHHEALAAAAADGRLWELWFVAVPPPEGTDARSSACGRTVSISGHSGPSRRWAPNGTV